MNLDVQLFEAIDHNDEESVRELIEQDANLVHVRNEQGATPLHVATLHGQVGIAKLLIAKGADVNSPDDRFGATPAGWAIEYLRERGGFLAIELDDFEYAITRGDFDWVRRFIERFPRLKHERNSAGSSFRELAIAAGQGLEELFVSDDLPESQRD